MPETQSRSFHLVTVVWGKRFIDRFLTTTLPTILAENNIPAFAGINEATYFIYTTEQDEELLRGSDLIVELQKHLPVIFVTDRYQAEQAKYVRVKVMHQAALTNAATASAATILLPPDGIWSDGTLSKISEMSEQGYRAVMSDGLRTVRDPFMTAFSIEFPASSSGAISVDARKLLKLAIENLHPYEASIMWGSKMTHDVPFRLHWAVKGEGILTRGFCVLPILIDPETDVSDFVGAIDHGLVEAAINDPEKIYYCSGADDFAVVSVDELGFSSANYKTTGRREKILKIAQWAQREATPQNLDAPNYPFRRNFTEPTERRWKSIEKMSQHQLNAVLTCRKLLAIIEVMEKQGANKAAEILAYALNEGGITGWLGDVSPHTILVPTDRALEILSSSDNLKIQDKTTLRQKIFKYALPGIWSASDVSREFNVEVEQADIEVEDWWLQIIDRILED